ncbi:MAG: exo-alpha-sialidase [Pirellulales bacterium]
MNCFERLEFSLVVMVAMLPNLTHARPPNFIVIFCDDLGYADIGLFVAQKQQTPNLDRIADAKTPTVNPSDELQQTDVFSRGQNDFHTYRIPSLLVTPKGSLLAICEGRKTGGGDHGDLDLVMKRSNDLGTTWSDLQLIYEEGGKQKITIGNPCPVVDQSTGTIWLPFCRNNREILITSSSDDGLTWSVPREITAAVKPAGWGWVATGPGVGIQLTRGKYRGRLVIPCDHYEERDSGKVKMSHLFYSDDHGQSWQLGGSVADHTDECQVVELHDGRLMMNMRNYWARDGGKPELGGMRAVAISEDGGQTWGELMFDSTLIEPVCQASFLKHSHDKFQPAPLLFSNPASSSKRHRLTVRLSNDGANTWPVERLLHRGPAAYSCLTVLPDRSIGCLYECGDTDAYEKIRFSRFTLTWLQQKGK